MLIIPLLGKWTQRIPGTHWTASLAHMPIPRSQKDYLKNKADEDVGMALEAVDLWLLHAQAHTCVYTCMCSHWNIHMHTKVARVTHQRLN